jgi:hypothetical protein
MTYTIDLRTFIFILEKLLIAIFIYSCNDQLKIVVERRDTAYGRYCFVVSAMESGTVI